MNESLIPQLIPESAEELYENAPCGYLSALPDGTIVRVNQTFLNWTGYTRSALLEGRRLQELLTLPGRMFYETHFAPLLRMQGFVNEIACDLLRPNAEPLPALLNSVQILNDAGQPALIRFTVFNATDRRRYERELLLTRRRAEHYATIVKASADAILSVGADGAVQTWNAGAERLFGYAAADVVGRQVLELLDPVNLAEQESFVLAELREGRSVQVETVCTGKDRQRLDVSVSLTPHIEPPGELTGVSAILRDISERKRIEAEREELLSQARQARAIAEAATLAKDEFLSVVTHELRNPLNSILGYARLTRRSPHDAAQVARHCEIIERNAKVQQQLIEDLLDIARIVSGQLRIETSPMDLRIVLEDALAVVKPAAEAKQIDLVGMFGWEPQQITGDAERLQQVFWNLLQNAVKFTPSGGRVELQMEQADQHIHIAVRDTGKGIEPEFLPVVFDRFSQNDSSRTRRQGGLGLGLALVKQLVELHGGTVQAASDGVGRGSTFTVTLPLRASQVETPPSLPILPEIKNTVETITLGGLPRLDGVRVLMVDDEPESIEMLRLMLKGCDAEVEIATSAKDALKIIESCPPDILISDIKMPEQNGYEFIESLP
jgi:PAS domain S-box-containing protein